MPNYTSRFNLSKPLTTENYDIAKVTNENADKLDASATQLLTTTETITVGTGGQYATINQALAYATNKYPTYVSASTRPRITISLLSGFVMAEQVLVDGIDLSWITISSVDAEVSITRSALTISFGSGYPAFAVINGGSLPIINTLFNMDTSGTSTNRHGVLVKDAGSRCIVNGSKGVKNAGGHGLYANSGAIAKCSNANFSGAGAYGIIAEFASIINANSANASYAGTCGVYAINASTIEFASGNAQRAGYNTSDVLVNANADGIYANQVSTINARSSDASYSARYGVTAHQNSRINFTSGTATNTGSYSIYANFSSVISALSSNCSTDGSPSSEYVCSLNSFIDITSATGEVNTDPPLNSYTYAGLITNNTGVITTSGSLPLTGGTLTGLLTTNGQIKFPATQNPSADANTLDDYEEGTFTPTLGAVSSNPTVNYEFGATGGRYIKIGKMVFVSLEVRWNSLSGGSGNVRIENLPFIRVSSFNPDGDKISVQTYNISYSGNSLVGNIVSNTNVLSVEYSVSGNVTQSINVSNLPTGFGFIRVSGIYEATA